MRTSFDPLLHGVYHWHIHRGAFCREKPKVCPEKRYHQFLDVHPRLFYHFYRSGSFGHFSRYISGSKHPLVRDRRGNTCYRPGHSLHRSIQIEISRQGKENPPEKQTTRRYRDLSCRNGICSGMDSLCGPDIGSHPDYGCHHPGHREGHNPAHFLLCRHGPSLLSLSHYPS